MFHALMLPATEDGYNDMKRLIYAMVLALAVMTSCKKEGPEKPVTLSDMICHEWESTELPAETKIYLAFTADGKFEMYQKFTADNYTKYTGTWKIEGTVLSGTYSNGSAWASSYDVTIDEETLTMVSKSEEADETIYKVCTIPSVIKETASN